MTRERYYILATNLAKLRIADTILRDVLVMTDDPAIKQKDWRAMLVKIQQWTDGLYQAIDGTEVTEG